jgi:hypothetical protein
VQKAIKRFHLQLSPTDQNWFEGAWRDFDGSSSLYNQALDLDEILEHGKGIWGGMMLPDTMPLLANGMGDYLCARFTNNGTLSEIIEWCHEGAGWRHYGYSIDQAIAFDQMEYRQSNDIGDPEDSQLLARVSRVAMSEAACKRAVRTQLEIGCRRVGGRKLAALVGVSWNELSVWLRDPSGMPAPKCEQLASALGIDQREMMRQDWEAALSHSQSVLKVRADLAWPYAVAGQAFERLGCPEDAVKMYEAGVKKLGSSSSFTAHWSSVSDSGTGKFAVDRLLALAKDDFELTVKEYLKAIVEKKVRNFWFTCADTATKEGDHNAAYEYLCAAGWDFYYSNDILEILQAMKASAKLAGFPTLEAILELHIGSLV